MKKNNKLDSPPPIRWRGKTTPTIPTRPKIGAYRHQNLRRSGLYIYLKIPILPKDAKAIRKIESLADFENWLKKHNYFYNFTVKKEIKRLYKTFRESQLQDQDVAPDVYERYSLLTERDDVFPHLH